MPWRSGDLGNTIVRWQRPERDQAILDPELVIRKVIAIVNGVPGESAAFECTLTYENYNPAVRELDRHKVRFKRNRRQNKGTLYL